MATLAQTAQGVLPGWGYYLGADSGRGDFGAENVNNQFGQQFLADLQKYDPSAHFRSTGELGGEGSGGEHFTLDYDPSKLPGGGRPGDHYGVDMNQGAFAGLRNDPNASYAGHLFNSDAIKTDPNGYGQVTDRRNQNIAADQAPDFIGKYGPMIIAAIASMGAAVPAMAAGGGLSSLMGGMGAGGNMAMGLVNGARALSNGGGVESLIPAAISMGGGALGLPSWATGAANTAYGMAQGRKPDPMSAGMTLARMANFGGPGG